MIRPSGTPEFSEVFMHFGWFIALSIVSSVIAQTVFKLGLSTPGETQSPTSILSLLTIILRSPLVLTGLFLYGVGALAWINVLSRVQLSYAYPFLALNFLLITLTATVVLGESISWMRWAGVLVICVGILIVARSNS